jgi:DNA-binding IclR family transcriptional regulator
MMFTGMNEIKSAARVLDLLELLSMQDAPARLSEIVRTLGWPKSSTHGLLNTLAHRGYVERDDADRYAITPAFRDGFGWVGGFEALLRRHALPIMTAARDQCGETLFLCVADENGDVKQICKVVSTHPIRYDAVSGRTVPAYASVMGRVLLAHAPAERVDAYFRRTVLEPFTEKSLTDEAAIRVVLEDIRRRGYGTIEEEYAIGGCGIAAPVRDRTGQVVAVLDIATVAQRYVLRRQEMLETVLKSAAVLSAKLGFHAGPNGKEA